MRLLLADDNGIIRRVLTELCSRSGHVVESAANGQQAWDAYRERRHDIVVLDWMMPHVDGLEVCRRIRELDTEKDSYILVVTSRDTKTDVTEVLAAGADDYVPKPVTAPHFRARLQIAEQRIAERVRYKDALAALVHAEWLGGIGVTTVALSHEINNPLHILLVEAELLGEDDAATSFQKKQTAIIMQNAKRIAGVVKRLEALRDPHTVESIRGLRMLDLS